VPITLWIGVILLVIPQEDELRAAKSSSTLTAGLELRLFIAIELPENVKKALLKVRVDIPGARWVPVEQIHLTLAFLGEVDEITLTRLTEALARIRIAEFQLCFSGSGCFPNLHRPRVLWLGLKLEAHLLDLACRVREAVQFCGIPHDDRPFSPHITLARLKLSPTREFYEFFERTKTLRIPSFLVSEFTLFQSLINQQGAVHIPVRSFSADSLRLEN